MIPSVAVPLHFFAPGPHDVVADADKNDCPRCKGTGKIKSGSAVITCPKCQGAGTSTAAKLDACVAAADRAGRRADADPNEGSMTSARRYEVTLTLDDGKTIREVVRAASGVIAEGDVRYKHGRPKAKATVRTVSADSDHKDWGRGADDPRDKSEGGKYNAEAVNKEIAKDKRIGGKEAKLIHSLLKGRTKTDSAEDAILLAKLKKAKEAAAKFQDKKSGAYLEAYAEVERLERRIADK